MARHRKKSGGGNRLLILVQILIMAGVLVFIIFFRDTIGSGASSAFDTVAGTEDLQVEKSEDESAKAPEARQNAAADDADAGNSSDDSSEK